MKFGRIPRERKLLEAFQMQLLKRFTVKLPEQYPMELLDNLSMECLEELLIPTSKGNRGKILQGIHDWNNSKSNF